MDDWSSSSSSSDWSSNSEGELSELSECGDYMGIDWDNPKHVDKIEDAIEYTINNELYHTPGRRARRFTRKIVREYDRWHNDQELDPRNIGRLRKVFNHLGAEGCSAMVNLGFDDLPEASSVENSEDDDVSSVDTIAMDLKNKRIRPNDLADFKQKNYLTEKKLQRFQERQDKFRKNKRYNIAREFRRTAGPTLAEKEAYVISKVERMKEENKKCNSVSDLRRVNYNNGILGQLCRINRDKNLNNDEKLERCYSYLRLKHRGKIMPGDITRDGDALKQTLVPVFGGKRAYELQHKLATEQDSKFPLNKRTREE